MVRTPPGYHLRAGGWPPGSVVPAGSHVDRRVLPASVAPHHYLTPGQVPIGPYGFAQGTVPGFATTTGSSNAPPQFTILNSVPVPAGTYTVNWSVTVSGTTAAAEVNNFLLVLPGLSGITSVNGSAPGTYPQAPVTFTTTGGTAFLQTGANNATAGSVYSETLFTASSPLTLHVGPTGYGTGWDLAQASIATTTGANDTATAAFFAQPFGTPSPAWQVGQSYAAGGDQVGLSGVKLVTGEFLFVTWTGAKAGDTATLILSGVQTVLM